MREGSLEAPTRHPIDWKSDTFWDKDALNDELERVYDICHGCRRCVSLCDSFPTLFDLIDESETFEVDGVDRADYTKVVDQCYLCDLCFLTKCPYVPPHEFNVDFPHLMLRAKAIKFKEQGGNLRDKSLTSTDTMLGIMSIPYAIRHHLHDRSEAGRLVGNRYLGAPQLTGLQGVITQAVPVLQQQQIFTPQITGGELLSTRQGMPPGARQQKIVLGQGHHLHPLCGKR